MLLTYVIVATACICILQAITASSAQTSNKYADTTSNDLKMQDDISICHVHNSFAIAMSRAFLTIVQGVWFFGIAMNEYSINNKLEAANPGDVMFVPFMFCILSMSILACICILYYCIIIRGILADNIKVNTNRNKNKVGNIDSKRIVGKV